MNELTSDRRFFRATNLALWALQIVTAAAFLMAGFGSLLGYPMMVETFAKIGIGQWFRYVTGGVEIVSVILLLIPRLAPVGAVLLICTMIGAVLTHLLLIGGSPVPGLILACLAAIILWGGLGTLKALLGNLPAPAMPVAEPGNSVTSPSHAR